MSNGKYRITKIRRAWEGDTKYSIERFVIKDKVMFLKSYDSKEQNSKKLIDSYYSLFLEDKQSDKCSVFRTKKLVKKLKDYEKTEKIGKRLPYPNEIEVLTKRVELFEKFNEVLLYIYVQNKESFKKESKLCSGVEIVPDGLKISKDDFEMAFDNKEKGKDTNTIFSYNIQQKFKNQSSDFATFFKDVAFEDKIDYDDSVVKMFLKEKKIYRFIENATMCNRKNKKEYTREINLEDRRKSSLKNRLYSSRKTKMHITESKTLKNVIVECLCWYDLRSLAEMIKDGQVIPKKIVVKEDLSQLILCVKKHYQQKITSKVKVMDKEKFTKEHQYVLKHIHDYVKGRYRKFIDRLSKYPKGKENEIKQKEVLYIFGILKNDIDVSYLEKKIKTSLRNKILSDILYEGRGKYHILKSQDSLNLQFVKAKETFYSKLSTSISMAAYTLSSQISPEQFEDFLGGKNKFSEFKKLNKVELFNSNIIQNFFVSKNDEVVDGKEEHTVMMENLDENEINLFLHTIYELRNRIAHYNIDHTDSRKEEESLIQKINDFITKMNGEMKKMYIHSLNSNNIPEYYSENDIEKLIHLFTFAPSKDALYYPSFDHVYKELKRISTSKKFESTYSKFSEVIGNFRNVKEMVGNESFEASRQYAFKFLLQEIYYNLFIHRNEEHCLCVYKELYDVTDDQITEHFSKELKTFRESIQREASFKDKDRRTDTYVRRMNQKWIHFITSQFIFFVNANENCSFVTTISDQRSGKVISTTDDVGKRLMENLSIETVDKDSLQEVEYGFVLVAMLITRKEVSHLLHDIRKFKQFILELCEKSEKLKVCLSDDLKKIKENIKMYDRLDELLSMIVKLKDREIYRKIPKTDEVYKEELESIMNFKLEEAVVCVSKETQNNETKKRNLFADDQHFILLSGLERTKRYGTYTLIKDFLDTHTTSEKTYKFGKEDLSYINKYFDKREELNDTYTKFLKNFNESMKGKTKQERYDKANTFKNKTSSSHIDIEKGKYNKMIEAHKEYLNYTYAQSKCNGDQLNKIHHFIMDVYSHFLSWSSRWERDVKYYITEKSTEKSTENILRTVSNLREKYNVEDALEKCYEDHKFELCFLKLVSFKSSEDYFKEVEFRNCIAHFNYFSTSEEKSLLDICNQFYDLFSYNTKYQRDVQTVMNNLFEKYGIVSKESNAPVLKYCKKDKKLVLSERKKICPKTHLYFDEIQLVHENQVSMLLDLFEYRKTFNKKQNGSTT